MRRSVREYGDVGAACRRRHERWLNQALDRTDVPRIPVRRVDKGGFARLLTDARGRLAIRRWWRRILAMPGLDVDEAGVV